MFLGLGVSLCELLIVVALVDLSCPKFADLASFLEFNLNLPIVITIFFC